MRMEKILNLNFAIATAIKQAREEAGLTQTQLAGFSGLSEIYISSLERGQKGDSINALFLIARALEIDTASLVFTIETTLKQHTTAPVVRRGRPQKRIKPA